MHFNQVMKKSLFVLSAACLLFTSCKKGDSNPINDGEDNGGYAGDASKIEWINNDVISIADAAGTFYNGVYMKGTNTFGDCALVATDTLSHPRVLTIRFGDKNCKCLDGNYRRGTILVMYEGDFTNGLSLASDTNKIYTQHLIKYAGYAINDMELKGSVTTSRIDTTVLGSWFYNVKVDDTLVTRPNAYLIWKGSLKRRWTDGYNTGDRSDNVYSISGSATLTRENGHKFVFDIATPLKFSQNCNYAESGVVNVSGYTGARIINYTLSTGSQQCGCDNDAQLQIGPYIYQVKL